MIKNKIMGAKKEQLELYNKLSKITDDLLSGTEKLLEIKNEEEITMAAACFKSGQAYTLIDKVHDDLLQLMDDLDEFTNN